MKCYQCKEPLEGDSVKFGTLYFHPRCFDRWDGQLDEHRGKDI